MHDASAAWLMTGLAPSPLMVSLMQTATSLPFFLLALPAGALADIVDRRRLLLATQLWMLVAATALGVSTVAGRTGPWLLRSLTFGMGLGNALNAPAWQATTPDLVPREELAAAVALGGISVNVARAVGPALGGLLVAALGAGWVFLLNAASFLGVVVVLARWQHEVPRSRLPPEDVPGAMRAGVRYVRHSAPFHAVLALTAAAPTAGPAWGRARALAVGLLAVQGSMAVGSLLWGVVATHADIPTALVTGAALLLVGAVASRRFALHGLSNLDLRPDPRWSLPETASQLDGDEGPVLVTLEYDVDPDQAEEFLRTVRRLEPVRRRDGAIRWSVYRDTEDPHRWLEMFVVESWIEHLRQHERVTADDRALFEAAARFDRGGNGPRVRHHIAGRQAERLRWDDRAAR